MTVRAALSHNLITTFTSLLYSRYRRCSDLVRINVYKVGLPWSVWVGLPWAVREGNLMGVNCVGEYW